MKRITIEEAENAPQRIGMRKPLSWSDLREHHCIKTWKLVRRFVEKYVGHKWDKCYSDFLDKINSERIFSKGEFRDWMIYQFKDFFVEFQPYRYRSEGEFYINHAGIICRNPEYKEYHSRRTSIYSDYVYKLRNFHNWSDRNLYEVFLIYLKRDLYEKALEGIDEDTYYKIINNYDLEIALRKIRPYYSVRNYFEKIPIGEPLEGREATRRFHELEDKARKYKRERDKYISEHMFTIGSFATRRKAKKAAKEAALARFKREQEENAITRDRLGFAEDSFTTYQKFNK